MKHTRYLIAPAFFTAVGLLAAAECRADRAAVEFTLARMKQAVLAGDAAAYLMNIATDDPVFRKEQENWARDLGRHTPSDFTLEIFDPAVKPPETNHGKSPDETAGARAPEFDDENGSARCEVVMSWTLPGLGRNGEAVEREISFPVRFTRGEDGRWLYAGEDWKQVESCKPKDKPAPEWLVSAAPNVAYFFEGFEAVAQRVTDILPEVRAHVDAEFANPIEHRQVIKIYPSMRHLQASIYLSYVDGLTGWNEPGEAIKLLASNKTDPGILRALLAHEYGHVATFEFGPHATDMPWWALEGVAEQSAEKFVAENGGYVDKPEEYGRDAARAVERWARRGKLAPWDRIAVFRDTPREFGGHVYKQGHHMLGFISRRFGREARNAWLRHLAQHTGPDAIDAATREVFSLAGGFAELDAAWRAELPPRRVDDDKEEKAAP